MKTTPPGEDDGETVSVTDLSYIGEGVHSTGINAAYYSDRDLLRTLVARQITRSDIFGRTPDEQILSDVQIVADCLWEFIAFGFVDDIVSDAGAYLEKYCYRRRLNYSLKYERETRHLGRRSTDEPNRLYRCARIEETCSYIDKYKVTGITGKELWTYKEVKNFKDVDFVTPYTLPQSAAAYQLNCCLDDNMWFNDETKTIVIISASRGYEQQVCEIKDFIHAHLKNPMILYGKNKLRGIVMKAIFITE
ncbi:MAG: hypothetical protein K2I18_03030 [Paramuribaculum sp.]|nr:hypothetical protein [Paramuribaculum sp.]